MGRKGPALLQAELPNHFIPSPLFSGLLTDTSYRTVSHLWLKVEKHCLSLPLEEREGSGDEVKVKTTVHHLVSTAKKLHIKCFSFTSYCTFFPLGTISHRVLFVFSLVYLQRYSGLILDTRGYKSFKQGCSKLDYNYKK